VSGNSEHVQDPVDLAVFVATTVVVTHQQLIVRLLSWPRCHTRSSNSRGMVPRFALAGDKRLFHACFAGEACAEAAADETRRLARLSGCSSQASSYEDSQGRETAGRCVFLPRSIRCVRPNGCCRSGYQPTRSSSVRAVPQSSPETSEFPSRSPCLPSPTKETPRCSLSGKPPPRSSSLAPNHRAWSTPSRSGGPRREASWAPWGAG